MRFFAFVLCFASACAPVLQIHPSAVVRTDPYPQYVEIADLDGDGHPDLVLTRALPRNEIVVFQGDGQGGFRQRSILTGTGVGANRVAIGDLDGDGHLDLVAAGFNGGAVTLLRGRGDFTFHPTLVEPVGFGQGKPFLADVDGDGKLDVILPLDRLFAGDQSSGRVATLRGRGDGTFDPATVTVIGTAAHGIVVGDLDGDGRADVVVGDDFLHREVILVGCADGTLAWKGTLPSRFGVGAGVIADFNGDGKPDLALGGDGITLWLGHGDATFTEAGSAGGEPHQHLRVADLDGDGHLDLVTQHYVFLGDGRGQFRTIELRHVAYDRSTIAIGDVNGDRRDDLLIVDHAHEHVRIYTNLAATLHMN